MSDEKTYIFPDGAGNTNGMDPAALMAMMNNGGFGNGSWIWVIFLFFLYGWGGNEMFGRGNGIDSGLGTDLVMQAVNGNRSAISDLAGRLNCDINSINTAINAVQSSVQNVGSQVGMSGLQVINAIQSGNQTLAASLADCCCQNKLLITQSNYENQISTLNQTNQLGSKIDANSNSITSAIASQTTFLSDKFCELEKREMQSKIDSLLEEKNTLQTNIAFANQTGQIQAYISGIVSPLATEINTIKNALPQTVSVPYTPYTVIPNYNGFNYTGYNYYGVNPGSIWS